jgi:alkaline phosphatase
MRKGKLTGILAASLAVLLALAVGGLVLVSSARAAERPKNIIIMFADGAASTQWDFGRYSSSVLRQQPFVTTEVVFRQGVLGLLTTSPHGPYVTDSAAGW